MTTFDQKMLSTLLFFWATQYWTDGSLRTAYKRIDLTWNPSPTDKSNYDLPTLDFYQCHLYTDFEDMLNPCRMTGWDSMISHKPVLIGEVQVTTPNLIIIAQGRLSDCAFIVSHSHANVIARCFCSSLPTAGTI
jgi:hypothetical protein